MRDLAILVPVLGRPHRVAPLLDSIQAATPRARVVFLTSPGDGSEEEAIRGFLEMDGPASIVVDTVQCDGNYAAKINVGVGRTTEPLIFTGADDLHFHPGWFEAASRKLTDKIQVIGTNDLCNGRVLRGEHSTHSLLTREYAERGTIDDPTKVLHEGYLHEYVDDEFVQTAIKRGAFGFAKDARVEHLHPDAGKAPIDALYADRPRRMRQGRRLYMRRRALFR